ncbi:phage Gp37/Gp68 family protein [Sinorhizobium meliloti]|uniref:phage Gp37/Gp68 family protein n=1 Tax=Rhizobium meliloti TaxID=382 RepID=UPI000FD8D66F|nr:phage Gp37/Gp68 family protein [Sinorhizobium meliloti]RVK96084.1 phage Gp37/Gp68 family protein [Sinorhizobium meliloti]RVN50895.1 phage Gp37/Gp68 family protein [Sinorhizobium meliloti]
MADGTKIEWTDATWNPITGCAVVSPGCTNCYAMKLAGTRLRNHESRKGLTKDTKAGPVWTGEMRFNRQWLEQPLRWTKPRMIFVCAHGDLFAEGVQDEWIDQVFSVMALAPQHTFQVLTKRPDRMRDYFAGRRANFGRASDVLHEQISHGLTEDEQQDAVDRLDLFDSIGKPLTNVWLGVSVEDQKRADERIPVLLDTPAAVRWISAEPLLGPLDLISFLGGTLRIGKIAIKVPAVRLDWVVAGGESGRGARPMHPDWTRSLRDQCAAADVPFLFKQWGSWKPVPWKLDRRDHETDREYVERSEAACSQIAISKGGYLHEMSHKPWSIERVLLAPDTHHAVKNGGKKAAGRLLDGIEHNGFPEVRR